MHVLNMILIKVYRFKFSEILLLVLGGVVILQTCAVIWPSLETGQTCSITHAITCWRLFVNKPC